MLSKNSVSLGSPFAPVVAGRTGEVRRTLAILIVCTVASVSRVGASPSRSGDAGRRIPAKLNQSQWRFVFKAAARRIVSLHLAALITTRTYLSRSQISALDDIRRKTMTPGEWERYQRKYNPVLVPGFNFPGYGTQVTSVHLKWEIAPRRIYAKRIFVFGGNRRQLRELRASGPEIAIWVVGQNREWYARLGNGTWSVSIHRPNGAWASARWPERYSTFGLKDIVHAVDPWRPFSKHIHQSHRLIKQKYNPQTGIIKLVYCDLRKGKPVVVSGGGGLRGKWEVRYDLKLAGGLRVYSKTADVVEGSTRVPMYELSFRRFQKSSGVWFPTRIRERLWSGRQLKRMEFDAKVKIQHLIVNEIFPRHSFRYVPPFGASVYDGFTKTSYYVGSRHPNVPPAMAPDRKREGDGKK